MPLRPVGDVVWCERCWHSHRAGAPCVTVCVDCELKLVAEAELYLRGAGDEDE